MTSQDADQQELQKAFDEAVELHRSGDTDAAIPVYNKVHEIWPDHSGALHMLGVVALQSGEGEKAEAYLKQATDIEPVNAKMLNNFGNSLYQQRKFSAAAVIYRRAIEAEPDAIDPLYNLGTALYELGDVSAAIENFDFVLTREPGHAEALLNLGVCYKELKQFAEAAFCFRTLLELQPDDFASLVNLANVLIATEVWNEAKDIFFRASKLQPDHAGVHLELLKLAQGAGDFEAVTLHYENLVQNLPKMIGKTTDWQFLASVAYQNLFTEIPAELLGEVTSRIDSLVTPVDPGLSFDKPAQKIRVGYMSSNFGDHPVGHVTSALFQAHDRNRFEIFGFSLNDRTAERQSFADNLKNDFDEFHQVGQVPPEQAAQQINALGIHILVDLDGFMSSKGLRIQAHRPAQFQLFWLGHAGGVGQSYIDGLIADQIVLPEAERNHTQDTVVDLPDIYHCAAPHPISENVPRRAHFKLPETGPVFCGFNNPEKINQEVFDAWMEILRKVPESVLWLSSKRGWPSLIQNLKARADSLGVAEERIIFADRVADKVDHLARHQHACLFLDTLTLNASTTALDSLWAGLPVLAVAGDRFPSRISQTMLRAVGLPEMICPDINSYIARAVEIASDDAKQHALKAKLKENLKTEPLFDVARFTENLEQVYLRLIKQAK